jgi:integrase
MSVERAAVYPTGPLFRTTRGVPWGKAKRISEGFRALRRRVGLPEDLVPYGMRHAFASEALAGGETEAVVAALLGHASTRMVSETYGHVGDMAKVMRDALGRVRKSA